MNKIIILIAIFFSFLTFSQFEKFENNDLVKSYIVNKKMFEMMSKIKIDANDEEAKKYIDLIKKLDKLSVYTTSNPKLTADFKTTAQSYITDNKLEELMRVNEGNKNVKVYLKNCTSKELFMLVEDSESIMLSLKGNFDLNEISVLTEKLNLPGKEELKKATKKQ